MSGISLLGEFRAAALESRFRVETVSNMRLLNILAATMLVIAVIMLGLGDLAWSAEGINRVRLIQLGFGALLLGVSIVKVDARWVYIVTYVIVMVILSTALVVDFRRPPDYLEHLGFDAICLMIIYLFLPASFVRLGFAFAFTIGLLVIHFYIKTPVYEQAGTTVVITLLAANLVGIMTSSIYQRQRRLTFSQLLVERDLKEKLLATEEEAKRLSRLLPMCRQCKKVRNDNGQWEDIESLIMGMSGTQVSHGLCPACAEIYGK